MKWTEYLPEPCECGRNAYVVNSLTGFKRCCYCGKITKHKEG